MLAASLGVAQESVSLKAEKHEWVQDAYWSGQGKVELHYGDVTIKADTLFYDMVNGTVEAHGNVLLEQRDTTVRAESLRYSVRERTGTLTTVDAKFQNDYFFIGERLEKVAENRYRLFDGEFTACDMESPSWSFNIHQGTLEAEGYAYLGGTSLRVHRFPVFYIPYMVWPTKRDRSPGLLVPRIGHSMKRGFYLGLSDFQPLGDSYDLTLLADLFSEGALGGGVRFRYAPVEGMTGQASGYYVRDIDDVGRWKGSWDHAQKGLPGGMTLAAHLEAISDIDFFKEFENVFDRNTNRQVYSHVSSTGGWGNHSLLLKLDRRETYTDSTDKILIQQFPKAEVRFRPLNLWGTPLSFSYQARFNLFNVDKVNAYRGTYGRGDLFPVFAYSLSTLPWLSFTPQAGYRATYYTKTLNEAQELEGDPFLRHYLFLGAQAAGPRFSRLFTLGGRKFKHLVEPTAQYTEYSRLADTTVPVADENDTITARREVRYALVNRVLMKTAAGTSEVFLFEISQRMSLEDDQPLTRVTENKLTLTSARGPLDFALRFSPAPAFITDVRLGFNAVTHGWETFTFLSSTTVARQRVNLSFTATHPQSTGATATEFVRLITVLNLASRVQLNAGVSYDLERHYPSQQEYVLTYLSGCWTGALEYRDFRSSGNPTREFRIAITLKNVGSFLQFKSDLGGAFGGAP
jgi:LPS-assembly protein